MEPVFNNTRRTKKQGGSRTRGCILRAAFAVVNNAFQETAVCIPRKERKRNKLETLESQEKTEILYCSGIPANQGSSRSQRQCCEMCHHLSAEPWNSLLKNLLFLSLWLQEEKPWTQQSLSTTDSEIWSQGAWLSFHSACTAPLSASLLPLKFSVVL